MNRNVTAIYRTYQVADLVRQRLSDLGISRSNIRIIPDRDETLGTSDYTGTGTAAGTAGTAPGAAGTTGMPGSADTSGTTGYTGAAGTTGTAGYGDTAGAGGYTDAAGAAGTRDDRRYMDELHDLHVPDEDLRTYQQSVRRGDYVVSVEVDETDVARVQEVMRRPETETYDLATRGAEFGNEELIAHTDTGRTLDESRRGQRDTAYDDPYTRTYRRGTPGNTSPR